MSNFFQDIIDLESICELLQSLQEATGIPVSLIDHQGELLVSSGWQDACALYHHKHPVTAERCRQSRNFFSSFLEEQPPPADGYIRHTCQNGLIEIGLPVLLDGNHFATLLFGQFLPEDSDLDLFRKTASETGINGAGYLDAIARVPVYDQAVVDRLFKLYSGIAELLTRLARKHIEEDTARQKLQQSEAKFRSIIEASPMGVHLYRLNPQGQLTLSGANDSADRILGISHAELIGQEIVQAFPGLVGSSIPESYREICRNGGNWSDTRLEYTDDRLAGAFEVHAFQTEPDNMAVFFFEITDRIEAERNLRESEEKYRLLFSAETDAIIIFSSTSHQIIEVNAAALALYGYSKDEFTELNAIDLSARPEYSREKIREIAARKRPQLIKGLHKKKDGSVFPAEIAAGTFEWKGESLHVAIIRDTSERERLDMLKDEMLSSISHEMRTPLTAILGFNELMLQQQFEPEQVRQFLEMTYREGERLKDLMDDLLDLQRLRAGFTGSQFTPLQIEPLLREVVHTFVEKKCNHPLEVECSEKLPELVADSQKLLRALKNLVSNAVKYSPEGSTITLEAKLSADASVMVIGVSDQGLGIPVEIQDQLFDRFFRFYHPEVEDISGTGLGLALVREICRIHGGEARVESSPGKGSLFTLELPLAGPLKANPVDIDAKSTYLAD